jgi:polar amino acid transport system substrate-binding protein
MIKTLIFLGIITLTFCTPGCTSKKKDVKEQEILTFALGGQYPPFSFVNDENEVVGFDVDVGNEIAKRLGMKPKVLTTAWDGIIAGLLGKKFDMICGSMAITEERQKVVNFSIPYYRSGAQLFVKKDSKINSIDDFKEGMTLGVTLGTTFEEWVRKNRPDINLRTYTGGVPLMVIETLNVGRIDGFVTDRVVGLVAIKENNFSIEMAGNLLYKETMGIAVRKGDKKLLKKVNVALEEMFKDGTYEKTSKKWIGADIR